MANAITSISRGEPHGIATMADVLAIEAAGMRGLPASTYELIGRGAQIASDAPALSFFLTAEKHREPETWTYRALFGRITQTANLFHRLGVTKDGVVALALPNLPETHFALWGGEAAGVVVPLNPALETDAFVALLDTANAEVLVTLAPFPGSDLWSRIEPALARVPTLRHVVLVSLADHVGLGVDDARAMRQRAIVDVALAVPAHVEVHDFTCAIEGERADELVSARVFAKTDASSWFATGGTTGAPKLAMRTHENEIANAWSLAQVMGDDVGPGSVVFCGLPLFHVNAVMVTGLWPFSRGAHVVLGTSQGWRSPGLVARFWEIVAEHRVAFFSAVPTVYASLLEAPLGAHDVSSLRYGLCGAAAMPTELLRTFEARTGVAILEGYGLTEGACVSSINPPRGERRVGSIGLRVPGQAMKTVVVDEHGDYVRDCAVGEVGVVVVSGPNVFSGYRARAVDGGVRATPFLDCHDGARWLDTGDLGRVDGDGYFWLVGRKKDLIIRGGHNIDPAAIEEPLSRHPAVALAAAVAWPDAHAGEVPAAYVQLKKGATVSEKELVAHLERTMSERAALPKHVTIVDAIPLTAVGKIHKPTLRKRAAHDALTAALAHAHVAVTSFDVVDDPVRGMMARVVVDDLGARDAALRVLGRFTIGAHVDVLSGRQAALGRIATSSAATTTDDAKR